MKPKIEADLFRLEGLRVIELVLTAEFGATPIVVVPKPKGTIRFCGDSKVTVNKYADMQRYPLPHPKELRAVLAGRIFLKVDLPDASLQMEVDEKSRKYLVLQTHKGLFRYTRLPFGFHGARAIFQRPIDAILQGLEGVIAYLDYIIITGENQQQHFDLLPTLFICLRYAGIRLK